MTTTPKYDFSKPGRRYTPISCKRLGAIAPRHYGYTLTVSPPNTYAPLGVEGWYKHKADAQKRADALTQCEFNSPKP